MQNKGIVIVTAVLLTLASIFYLSFSVATRYYDGKAAELKDPIAQQDYKDSVLPKVFGNTNRTGLGPQGRYERYS